MTIALLVKVNDGLILSSDSATTLSFNQGRASTVANIYNNANKVFNLYKGLPVGAMTWGLGSMGPASIATLAKDLRRRFMGEDLAFAGWELDENSYTIEGVAEKAREFLHDGRYEKVVADANAAGMPVPVFGFLVAGYSSSADEPHAYVISFDDANPSGDIQEVIPEEAGASWWGMPDAIARILGGVSTAFPQTLLNTGLVSTPADALSIYAAVQNELNSQMVSPAMPVQDAIELAEFLVHATIQFVRFSPGNPTVGGPIEIATITKHEDFKWVQRKHFFDTRFNRLNGHS
ncbi:hypothetical protein [Microbacterium sp. NPDC087589]|uniref:hypothetical protein n=1 Tax=Microbacterium sp. NPDC087589 TaxID=3364191 RepID=UPI00381B72E2